MKLFNLAFFFLLFTAASAQESSTRWVIVPPQGDGAAILLADKSWTPTGARLYDKGERPILELQRKPAQELSIILFPNRSGTLTAEACREEILPGILKNPDLHIDKKTLVRGQMISSAGKPLATASYMLVDVVPAEARIATGIEIMQYNTFAFTADKDLCVEAHVSAMLSKHGKDAVIPPPLDDLLKELTADARYHGTAQDYARFASVFYSLSQDWATAALYYQDALSLLPDSAPKSATTSYRYLTDQTALAYGLSGNVARSRAVNEAAITKDPDYPMYYYNLACADAEEKNATAAREHLKQAFDRRANMLPGEKFPDPTKDDSIQKLRKDKAFWDFVQNLPKS